MIAEARSPITSGSWAPTTRIRPAPPLQHERRNHVSCFRDHGRAFRTYVDLDPPETSITRDVKRSETGKVKFRFKSDEVGATFECKLKGKELKRKLRAVQRLQLAAQVQGP